MFLAFRFAFYALFPVAAAYGLGSWDEAAGNFVITINADHLAELLAGYAASYASVFGLSRVAKARGGAT